MNDKISRYQILEEIGQGGFAIVYRGRDTTLDRYVALKQLRPHLVRDRDWIGRFHQEARTIAQLDHPHIVPVYDVYEKQERFFIVMRLVDGPSLETFVAQQGRLDWSQAFKIMEKIGDGLAYAHTHGVLHRDLKPANILLDKERGPMLSDFGLAKLIGAEQRTVAGDSQAVVGTPHYIAPELWEGMGAAPQSDIYALGCILFELLAGQKLFAGQTPPAIMKAHLAGVEFSRSWPAGVPAKLQEVLAVALAQSPNQRYSTVPEMMAALRSLDLASPAGPQPQLQKPPGPSQPPGPASARLRNVPLLNTKLYVTPTRTELVSRPRLIQQLQRGLSLGRKLTLVSAPAGFGKTTLVSSWLNQAPSAENGQPSPTKPPPNVAWISLDESDNDPVRFITYLVAALQNIDPDVGQNILLVPPLPAAENLAALLINDLTRVPDTFVLVLDDYHLISSGFVHEFVEFMLEHQPPQMHVVMTTREDPPLPLPRFRARGQIVEIRQADLRFTPQEAATFLNQTMNLNLTAKAIDTLESRTEGWIAGLQLAALTLQGRDAPHIANFIEAFSGSHRYVIDYLIEEVILQQPKNIRLFLKQTSILDRFCAPLCNAVTGQIDSKLIINYLEQVNLFLISLDDQRRWYRYHHLFAEFLQTELKSSERKALHQKAARWFESRDYFAEAIDHALAAEDIPTAGRLIAQVTDDSLHNSEFITLANWLAALPEDFVRASGELSIAKGWTSWLMGSVDAAHSYAAAASANLTVERSPSLRGKLIALQACLAVSRDSEGLKLAQDAISLLEDTDTFYTGMALLVLGEAQNLMGDTEAAIQTLSEALRLGQKHGDHLMVVGAMINLAQQLNWQGKRRQAAALCQQAVEHSLEAVGDTSSLTGLAYLGQAEMELHTGDLARAQGYLKKGLELTKNQTMLGFEISAKLVSAPLKFALGEAEAALATAHEVHRIVRAGNYETYEYISAALVADYQLKAGNLAAVEDWAKQVVLPDPATEEAMSVMRELELQIYARWLLTTEQVELAETLLATIERSSRQHKRRLILMINRLLQALIYQHRQQLGQARAVLEEAVRLAAPEGYREIFMQQGVELIRLLPQVRPASPAFVDSLLAIAAERFSRDDMALPPAGQTGLTPAEANTVLIEPLTDRELEVLQLVAAGKSNKAAAKTLVVTTGTVKKHLSNIFGKLGVNSRTQAVARARELGLIS